MNQFQIGDVKITRIIESEAPWPGTWLLPDANLDNVKKEADWLYPTFSDEKGKLRMSIHALVLESDGKCIIVDTCIGNEKARSNPAWANLHTPFLKDLEAAGITRDKVDRVICTHLHVDHVGWNTMLKDGKWVPTFPNARYLIGGTEWDYWSKFDGKDMRDPVEDSVRPVIDEGMADLIDSNFRVTDEVWLEPSPGQICRQWSASLRHPFRDAVRGQDREEGRLVPLHHVSSSDAKISMSTVALSFDNGPDPEVTPRVLDVLTRREVKASFFVLGKNLASRERMKLAERASAEGHRIGNHSFTHRVPLGLDPAPEAVEREIRATEHLLGGLAQNPKMFRPFGGGGKIGPHLLSPAAAAHLVSNHYTCVLWNSVPEDWIDQDAWVERALADATTRAHTLVVMHDILPRAMSHLDRFIGALLDAGHRIADEFPAECVPIVRGEVVRDISGFVSGAPA